MKKFKHKVAILIAGILLVTNSRLGVVDVHVFAAENGYEVDIPDDASDVSGGSAEDGNSENSTIDTEEAEAETDQPAENDKAEETDINVNDDENSDVSSGDAETSADVPARDTGEGENKDSAFVGLGTGPMPGTLGNPISFMNCDLIADDKYVVYQDKIGYIVLGKELELKVTKNTEEIKPEEEKSLADDKYRYYAVNSWLTKGENTLAIEATGQNNYKATRTVNLIYKVDTNAPIISNTKFEGKEAKDKKAYFASGEVKFYATTIDEIAMIDDGNGGRQADVNEYISGVEKIKIYFKKFNEESEGMESKDDLLAIDNNGNGSYSFPVGEYYIEKIVPIDKCGNGIDEENAKTIDKYVYVGDPNQLAPHYELSADNIKNSEEEGFNQKDVYDEKNAAWYSINKYGDDTLSLKVEYYVYGALDVSDSLFRIADGQETQNSQISLKNTDRIKKTEAGRKTLITAEYEIAAEEASGGEYEFTYKFFNEDSEIVRRTFPIRIDNTAPVATFNVSFTANKDKFYVTRLPNENKDESNTYSYSIGTIDGSVVANDDAFNLSIYSKDAADPNGSDVSGAYCEYEVDGEVDTSSTVKVSPCEDKKIDIELSLGSPEIEKRYRIKKVYLSDNAGNIAEIPVTENSENSAEDKVTYDVDTLAPRIDFSDFDKGTYVDKDGTIYLAANAKREFTVTDRNLALEKTEVKKTGSGIIPDISDPQNVEGTDQYKYRLAFNNEGLYEYSINASDVVNNSSTEKTKKIVVDTVDPLVSIAYSDGEQVIDSSVGAETYTRKTVTVTITVTEANLLDDGIVAMISGTDVSGNPVSKSVSKEEFTRSGIVYVASVEVKDEGEYTTDVTVTDKCNHSVSKATGKFIIDKTDPVINVTYDNNEAQSNYYYKAARVATIQVIDNNFDKELFDMHITASDAEPAVSGWSGSGSEHTLTVTFNADGKYKFNAKCVDKAGNNSNHYESEEFFVDKTKPSIKIDFDNEAAVNKMYFKNSRTATISIDELTFDDSLVTVIPVEGENVDQLPQISSFSGDDKKHTAKISFDKDGKYGFAISCKDLAGNGSDSVSSEVFVIDTTAPKISISGVEDMSANKGVVAPVITYEDKNVDKDKSRVEAVGKNNGDITATMTNTAITDGFRIAAADIPHEKKYDDLYVITADIHDLAGNETTEEIMFSVNRFGSVYVIDDVTQRVIDNYYTSKAPEISITEINIDELQWKNVSVGRDGDIRELKSGRDYTVSESEDEKSWNSFTYTVKPANFNKDGKYSVVISSKDAATNEQDNVVKDKEIEFAVDTTEPGIAVSGFENNGVYKEESHLISFNVTDNMGVTGAAVYDNDELVKEYTEEELASDGFTEQVELLAADKKRDIKIVSTDVAGNKGEVEYKNIIISLNDTKVIASEAESESEVLGEQRTNVEVEEVIPRKQGVPVLPIAAGSAVVVIGGYVIFEVLRRRKSVK